MDLSEYTYLTEINGIALVCITLGNTKIDKLDVDFCINLNERQFDFDVEKFIYDNIPLYNYYLGIDINLDKADYIFGIDANNVPFTLYDCQFCPLNSPLKTMRIVWNNIIVGQHISSKEDCRVNKLRCVVEDSKNNYRLSVGKAEYSIESETILVNTNWSELPDEKNNRIVFNGTLFELSSKTLIPFEKMKASFERLLEVYFLWIGYFPEIKDMKFFNESGEFIYAEHSRGLHFSKSSNVNLNRRLFPVDSKNYASPYEKWVDIREKTYPHLQFF